MGVKRPTGLDGEVEPDSAFQRFVARRRGKLLEIARRILGEESEAEDVVQDTLLAVWRRLGDAPIENLERYVLRAVRINALKRRARRTMDLPLDGRDLPAPEADDEDDLEIDAATLERAIRELPLPQQTTIRMKYYLGLTFDEIGRSLSVSMYTAASRCRYALAKLRRLLAKRDG